MKVSDFKQSKYLTRNDIPPQGALATIKGITAEDLAMEGQAPEIKPICHFHELDKPMVFKSTILSILEFAFGTDDMDHWVGRQIVIYWDPSVTFRGQRTGGLRVRTPEPVAQQAAPPPQQAPAQSPATPGPLPPPQVPHSQPLTQEQAMANLTSYAEQSQQQVQQQVDAGTFDPNAKLQPQQGPGEPIPDDGDGIPF